MKAILSALCISSLLLANFSLFPQAAAQCLTKNDDMSKASASTDLSGALEFNLRLFREMIPTDLKRNFVFSAYSIWNALTMAYFGSSGRTEEQLRQVLRFDDKLSTLQKWRSLEHMYKKRPETSSNYTFILANRVYFDQSIQLRSCMEDLFRTEIEKVDFTKPRETADRINIFVSETTKGTIKELVSEDDLMGATLVLANAAYFKGVWEKLFDKRNTRPQPFTGLDDIHYIVDTMEQQGEFRYAYDDQIKADVLELPYSGDSVSMILFKPFKNTQSNFNSMIQGLSVVKFEEIISKLQPTKINVKIPKFKLDTYSGNELLQAFARMGITDLSDSKKADFTALTLKRHISFDKSIHKAFIDVNEEGTVAAAATAIIATKSGGLSSFECNRPFMFVIRDRETKNLLFMGVYKSSDKIDQSNKPTGGTDGINFLPELDKSVPFPEKDGDNRIPVIPGQRGPSSVFSHDLFPTPSPSEPIIPPISEGSQRPRQLNPSFWDNRGSSSGRETNQNTNRNTFISGGNSGSIPRRDSDPNIDRIIPSSGGNNELIPESGDSNPSLNIPSTGNRRDNRGFNSVRRINQNPEQSIPLFGENRDDNRRPNRITPSFEENSRNFRRGRSDQDSSE